MKEANLPNLRKRRKDLKLSLREVAEMVGVSEATVSRWETGNISNMRQNHMVALAKALKTSPLWLLGIDLSNSLQEFLDSLLSKAESYKILAEQFHDEFINDKLKINQLYTIVLFLCQVEPAYYEEIANYLTFIISKHRNNID